MTGLANQFIYGSFNKDLVYPKFSNFMDGTNGWYRVGYHNTGFGYAPYDLSVSAITGGYGFWSEYNTDTTTVMTRLWDMINSTDPAIIAYVDQYLSGNHYDNYVRTTGSDYNHTTSLGLLEFLPSLAYMGPPPTTAPAPNVVGITQSQAEYTIIDADLAVGNLTMQHSPSVTPGHVIDQLPAAGSEVPIYSPIDLTISMGPDLDVPGDITGDRDVDLEDVALLGTYWLQCCDPCNPAPTVVPTAAINPPSPVCHVNSTVIILHTACPTPSATSGTTQPLKE